MKPIDLRNATFKDLQDRLTGQRRAVLELWRNQSEPMTTQDLAEASGFSILSLRPRSTELYQLGFLRLVSQADNQGLYQARSDSETLKHLQSIHATTQPELALV